MENQNHSKFYLKNVLTLAYLGDAVFSLMVRDHLVKSCDLKPSGLNKKANAVVCARFQAEIMEKLKPTLTEEEQDVVMRARNSHTNNKAKNSTLAEYNLATQFEALVGFWYLNKQEDKLKNMFETLVVGKLW